MVAGEAPPTLSPVTSPGTPLVDFGRAARDYARHRPGFPPAFFDHVAHLGIGAPGQRILDLGTGTGTLARGFAERGCDAVGLDPSEELLAQAATLAAEQHLSVRWVRGWAESTGLPDADFDVVCAGQCWHWFHGLRAATEARRLLRAGGRVLIAYFSYLPLPGTLAEATEQIILRHNPGWDWAGHDGRHPRFADNLVRAGLAAPATFDFVLPIAFTHEDWRGRFRAHAAVLTLPPEKVAAFDADLARLLADRFPEPLMVDHRLFGIVARK